MLGFETEEQQIELGQFYDFRGSYSDFGEDSEEESDERDNAMSKKSKKTLRKSEAPADDGWEDVEGGEGDGWETDSSASSLDSTELTSVRCDRTSTALEKKPQGHHRHDGWHSHAHHTHTLYHDDYELHLPGGKSVGHRSLNRYYRQHLREHPLSEKAVRRIADEPYPHGEDGEDVDVDMEEGGVEVEGEDMQLNRRERREEERYERRIAKRDNMGMVGLSDFKKREIERQNMRDRTVEIRGRNRYQAGTEKRHNKQKHYRDPLLQ